MKLQGFGTRFSVEGQAFKIQGSKLRVCVFGVVVVRAAKS